MRASMVACGILLLWPGSNLLGQAVKSDDRQQSCGAFVQKFYAWYVEKDAESSRKHSRTSDIALKERSDAFDAELSRRLKEDSEAQDKVKDDIVGLDFDPVLGGQDSCPRYETRKVTIDGDRCRVEIFGNCSGKHAKPDVVPELASRSGEWVFVNFRYPQSGETDDLLTILRKLRDDRKKQSAAPPR